MRKTTTLAGLLTLLTAAHAQAGGFKPFHSQPVVHGQVQSQQSPQPVSQSTAQPRRGFVPFHSQPIVHGSVQYQQPVVTELQAAVQPVLPQPAVAQPVIAQPAAAQPVIAQPAVAQPVIAQPAVAQPVIAQPAVAQPVLPQSTVAPPVASLAPGMDLEVLALRKELNTLRAQLKEQAERDARASTVSVVSTDRPIPRVEQPVLKPVTVSSTPLDTPQYVPAKPVQRPVEPRPLELGARVEDALEFQNLTGKYTDMFTEVAGSQLQTRHAANYNILMRKWFSSRKKTTPMRQNILAGYFKEGTPLVLAIDEEFEGISAPDYTPFVRKDPQSGEGIIPGVVKGTNIAVGISYGRQRELGRSYLEVPEQRKIGLEQLFGDTVPKGFVESLVGSFEGDEGEQVAVALYDGKQWYALKPTELWARARGMSAPRPVEMLQAGSGVRTKGLSSSGLTPEDRESESSKPLKVSYVPSANVPSANLDFVFHKGLAREKYNHIGGTIVQAQNTDGDMYELNMPYWYSQGRTGDCFRKNLLEKIVKEGTPVMVTVDENCCAACANKDFQRTPYGRLGPDDVDGDGSRDPMVPALANHGSVSYSVGIKYAKESHVRDALPMEAQRKIAIGQLFAGQGVTPAFVETMVASFEGSAGERATVAVYDGHQWSAMSPSQARRLTVEPQILVKK